MKGLTAEPTIIADDDVLDVIFGGHAGDEVGMLCETVSRGLCRLLLLAVVRAGMPAEVLFNRSLDLKVVFRMPTAEDFENGDAIWEEEE